LTHCWTEGMFEFIDKVLHSWPRRARHAYCCFLSNPQNLDIGGIISQPSESPFALALRSAECLLVVPNKTCSIYTRIWCVYEAFLAHSDQTPIFTATSPHRGLRHRVLVTTVVAVVGLNLAIVTCFTGLISAEMYTGYVLVAVISLLMCASFFLNAKSWALRWVNDIGAAMCGLMVAHCLHSKRQGAQQSMFDVVPMMHVATFFGLTAFFFIAREADRLWDLQAAKEADQLQKGYTGKLQDAASSVENDRLSILSEIRARHQEAAVEHAIGVLIDAGMSTPSLRSAASHGVNIHGAGWWSCGMVIMVAIVFIAHPISHAVLDHSCTGALRFVPWLKAAEGAMWAALFRVLGPDHRGFVVGVAVKVGVIPYYTTWAAWVGAAILQGTQGPHTNCLPDAAGAFLWGPAMVCTSAAGIGFCSSIPCCGRQCANMLLHWRLGACWSRPLSAEPPCDVVMGSSEESDAAPGSSDDHLETTSQAESDASSSLITP